MPTNRRFFLAPLAVLAAAACAVAQAPGTDTSFPVAPEVGPWMILVNSYAGSNSRQLAEDLIQEIRTNYHTAAYGYNRGGLERAKEHERIRKIKEQQQQFIAQAGLPADTRLRSPKTVRIEDQYAVLIGGFKDIDAARKALDEVRKLKPPSERLMHQTVGRDQTNRSLNPFLTAFVVRNPMVPVEKDARDDKPDPRLKEYNADESFSLLKCPKRWTLAVKSYQGRATIVQTQATEKSVVEKLTGSASGADLLNANAKQAHLVAEMLKKFGYEAYVLHTEFSSVVTVGGFDSADDPRMVQMQKLFMNELAKGHKSSVGQLHVIGGVGFFPQPMPMAVPKL